MPCEDSDRSDAAISQGILRIAGNQPEARKTQGRVLLRASEGAWPCRYLEFGLLASGTVSQ